MGATAPTGVLLDPMALAIVHEPDLAGDRLAVLPVLPVFQAAFGVVGERLTGGTAAATGGGAGGGATGHVARRVVAGGLAATAAMFSR